MAILTDVELFSVFIQILLKTVEEHIYCNSPWGRAS